MIRSVSTVSARLRNAFIDLIENDRDGPEACALLDELVESDDVLPREYCEMLGLDDGATFGAAARAVRSQLGCPSA